jgi:hypothetical protein
MSSRLEEIRSVFDELSENTGSRGQRIRNRIDKSSPIRLYAARTFPQRNLLLEIGSIEKAYLPSGFTQPRIKGLNIATEAGPSKKDGDLNLLLELQQTEAVDVFVTFVARVCEEMDQLEDPVDAVRSVISLLERWREFFSGGSDLLSEGRQTGLYGELHLMARLNDAGIPIGQIVKAWTGSKRTNQDFEFGDISIEVKSTAAVDATKVNITNIRQLDETGLDLLLLNRVVLDVRQGVDKTLPALIELLRSSISEGAPEVALEFEEKILQAKFRNEHAGHYANRSYTERSLDFYEVREGFPRLLKDKLPVGITNATYEVTLESCKSFEVSSTQAFSALRNYCD